MADIVNVKYDAEAYVPIWESQVSQQLYDMENDWVRDTAPSRWLILPFDKLEIDRAVRSTRLRTSRRALQTQPSRQRWQPCTRS